MSDAELSSSPPPPPSLKGGSSEGDWTCADCSNINFAWRNACNRCAKARTPTFQKKKKLGQEIGKQAAEKSRGLFSADDWQCNKCGNVNWARRQQCNVCNAPKFGEVEERTGFGGGYNDRGVVEYKEREDSSDDEYDEFGRKKKRNENCKESDRFPMKNVAVKDLKNEKKRVDDEEEEDEEEDDDDGDLSKYDLSDWGDATPAKSTDAKNSHSHPHTNRNNKRDRSRSRSRSRSKTHNSRSRSKSRSRSRSPLSKKY
ncbi:zinc finger Ran-binding domain-containing protein 2 [Atheta coriaria]|uniref:zinc finger Ran-binding domain-containing protein 2 n=1 Tax=Dalotia coriaria TaxID=877792 RepID=UPI0031F476AD